MPATQHPISSSSIASLRLILERRAATRLEAAEDRIFLRLLLLFFPGLERGEEGFPELRGVTAFGSLEDLPGVDAGTGFSVCAGDGCSPCGDSSGEAETGWPNTGRR